MIGNNSGLPESDISKVHQASSLKGRRVILCITGSIAAYKGCELARLLVKQGADVRVLMTHSALEFVGAATFSAITQHPVHTEMFGDKAVGESHVTLSATADLMIVAPATADILARMAHGRADDLVTSTALCCRCPMVIAPAMHPAMWSHPATQRNVSQLMQDGRAVFVGPVEGAVASGDVGFGRFADPAAIADQAITLLSPHDFSGKHLVITAGPTVEDLDPVRFLSNRSSGKMGYAIAHAAARRGARVTLISGPVELPCPPSVERICVRGALQMQQALLDTLGPSLDRGDAVIMSAAVSDFRFAQMSPAKLKRAVTKELPPLAENPDILAELGQRRGASRPLLIGFAVETDQEKIVQLAREKLAAKRVDAVIANLAADSLGLDDNRVTIVTRDSAEPLPALPKVELAQRLLDFIHARLEATT